MGITNLATTKYCCRLRLLRQSNIWKALGGGRERFHGTLDTKLWFLQNKHHYFVPFSFLLALSLVTT